MSWRLPCPGDCRVTHDQAGCRPGTRPRPGLARKGAFSVVCGMIAERSLSLPRRVLAARSVDRSMCGQRSAQRQVSAPEPATLRARAGNSPRQSRQLSAPEPATLRARAGKAPRSGNSPGTAESAIPNHLRPARGVITEPDPRGRHAFRAELEIARLGRPGRPGMGGLELVMTAQAAERYLVQVGDGRSVEVLTAGPADGLPVVFHTGTPSGLVDYAPIRDAATGIGLRCVLYARPGYGKSDPRPGRRVADAAADVAAILDQLGAGGFVTAGWSGGGPRPGLRRAPAGPLPGSGHAGWRRAARRERP